MYLCTHFTPARNIGSPLVRVLNKSRYHHLYTSHLLSIVKQKHSHCDLLFNPVISPHNFYMSNIYTFHFLVVKHLLYTTGSLRSVSKQKGKVKFLYYETTHEFHKR